MPNNMGVGNHKLLAMLLYGGHVIALMISMDVCVAGVGGSGIGVMTTMAAVRHISIKLSAIPKGQ